MPEDAEPARKDHGTRTLNITVEGFWLPQNIRTQLLTAETPHESLCLHQGRPCLPEESQGVEAWWPQLNQEQWGQLLALLEENRRAVPTGRHYWEQLEGALQVVSQRLESRHEPLLELALESIPVYTGYSRAMIALNLNALSFFALESMRAAMRQTISWQEAKSWQRLQDMPGRLCFTPATISGFLRAKLPFGRYRALFGKPHPPEHVLGFAAGNVPGTALLITFLAMATSQVSGKAPMVIIRNSRQEPIFSSLVLHAIEEVAPELVASVAVLIWDYADKELQRKLMRRADLVLAAASDETIAQLRAQTQDVSLLRKSKAPLVFHPHGHKVSFSVIGKEMVDTSRAAPNAPVPMLEIVALLAALDSVLWDQHGCLSSRLHFIEVGGLPGDPARAYADKLTQHMRTLATLLPRGAWPRQHLHDRFDRYKSLETRGEVQVISRYEDDFLIVIDHRMPNPYTFFSSVNDCQGRVILVRPVESLLEVPRCFLTLVPKHNLQSISVAVGASQQGLSKDFLRFAMRCSRCGVTAIRTLGRGAFPQLAYSWDGFIPLDLIASRATGHFTTIEFDQPVEELIQTFQMFKAMGEKMGLPLHHADF